MLVLAKPERPAGRFAGGDCGAPSGDRARQLDAHDAIRQSPEQAGRPAVRAHTVSRTSAVVTLRATRTATFPLPKHNPLMPLATWPAGRRSKFLPGRCPALQGRLTSSQYLPCSQHLHHAPAEPVSAIGLLACIAAVTSCRMSCIVLTTFGSLGDLHPYLAVGIELRPAAIPSSSRRARSTASGSRSSGSDSTRSAPTSRPPCATPRSSGESWTGRPGARP